MMKIAQNVYHFYKYGRVVYKSQTSGNVIRRKVSGDRTIKTVLNKDRKPVQQMNRLVNKNKDVLSTVFGKISFEPNTGIPLSRIKNKVYTIFKNEKRLTDYTKPGYDYKITPLSDGRKVYEVAYPEVTTIVKDGSVTTKMDSQTFIE